MWLAHVIAARLQEAWDVVKEMREVAERRKTSALLADAHHAKAVTLFYMGQVAKALTESGRAVELCLDGAGRISIDDNDPLAWSLEYQAWSGWFAGYPDRAVRSMDSALKRSRELNQAIILANSFIFEALLRICRREMLEVQRASDQLEVFAERIGSMSFLALNRINQGWIASTLGQHERAITTIRSGIERWANPALSVWFGALLAEACVRAGRYKEAMQVVTEARELALQTGQHHAESEVERVAGEALMMMGTENASEAEQCMRRAIAIAVNQGAKSSELRATTKLAGLLRDTRRTDEARSMLTEIYNWFTEGFDTADLKDAKALLDQLGE